MSETEQEVYQFRGRPGPRERCLKRYHRNPLFPEKSRVSQRAVNEARAQDLAELAQFEIDFKALVQNAVDLPPRAESDVVLALKAEGERLYLVAAGLGGEMEESIGGLRKLLEVIQRAIRAGAEGDLTAMNSLDEEEQARAQHFQLLEHDFVADLLRPEPVIAHDELAQSLLSEAPETVRAVVSVLDDAQARDLVNQSRELFSDLGFDDDIPADIWAAFEALSTATDEKSQTPDDE